jgi:hypothetical protein
MHRQVVSPRVEAALTLVVNEFADMEPMIAALTTMHKNFRSGRRLVRKSFGDDLEMVRRVRHSWVLWPEWGRWVMKSKHIFWGGTADRRGSTGTSAIIKQGAPILEDLRGHMQIVWTREGALAGDPDFRRPCA